VTDFWPGVLSRLIAREDLGAEAATDAMRPIMSGEATPAQVAAFVVALRATARDIGLGGVGHVDRSIKPILRDRPEIRHRGLPAEWRTLRQISADRLSHQLTSRSRLG
jgi:hypothetical protein